MIELREGNFPHVFWIDIDGTGTTATECAVLKKDGAGNVFFIKLNTLDNIDKQRMFDVINDRNASNFELWDLMSSKTLSNGRNALTYFHAFVKVLTPTNKILHVKAGQVGLGKAPVFSESPDQLSK